MGYLQGFLVTIRQHRLFGGKQVTRSYSGGRVVRRRAEAGTDRVRRPWRMPREKACDSSLSRRSSARTCSRVLSTLRA